MARKEYKVQANNFTGGLITEASPLSFPENSCLDILNMDINVDGSVERRKALQLEADAAVVETSVVSTNYENYVVSHIWKDAGTSGQNIVALKFDSTIKFFLETDSLSDNYLGEVDLEEYTTADVDILDLYEAVVSMTSIRGTLVVSGDIISTFYVEYVPTATPKFTTVPFTLFFRDLDGVDDELPVTKRPATLSDAHRYNLYNQGWDQTKIDDYKACVGCGELYPSNADIWSAGRDADNLFDPAEMDKIDFGNSPAPKGRFVLPVFSQEAGFNFGESDTVAISSVESDNFGSACRLEITTDTAHGLASGDYVIITNSSITCDGETYTIDGYYSVAVIGNVRFRITTGFSLSCCDTVTEASGTVYLNAVPRTGGFTTVRRPTALATYAGRVFYAGIRRQELTDKIFFSQIVSSPSRIGLCMQDNDPTSEIDPDIVATDGGVITIPSLGQVLCMKEMQTSLVVFTTAGVWEIKGEGDNFFNATGYSVRKITSTPALNAKSVVDVEGTLMFLGEDGIYVMQVNEVSMMLTAQNISDPAIKTYYLENIASCRCDVTGAYDYKNKKVIWAHGIPEADAEEEGEIQTQPALLPKRLLLSNALIFDLRTQSFTKYAFPFSWAELVGDDPDPNLRLRHLFAVRNVDADTPAIKWLCIYNRPSPLGNTLAFLEQRKDKADGFEDFNSSEVLSYVYTGHATLEDIGVKKTARQLILHMKRTEEGFTIDGETYTPIHPSSAKVRIAWDFTTDEASNKWQPEFQGYRYRQLSTPSGTGPIHVGYDVITTKTKLRGTGRAFSMRFQSEEGKDMNILGWSITGSAEGNE